MTGQKILVREKTTARTATGECMYIHVYMCTLYFSDYNGGHITHSAHVHVHTYMHVHVHVL